LPLDLVERVAAGDREEAANAELSALVHDGVDHLVGRRVGAPLLLYARHFRPSILVSAGLSTEPFPRLAGVRKIGFASDGVVLRKCHNPLARIPGTRENP